MSKSSPKYRVYVAEEEGALLVRHGKPSTSLQRALKTVARFAPAIAWEVRMFFNGTEKLVPVEHIRYDF